MKHIYYLPPSKALHSPLFGKLSRANNGLVNYEHIPDVLPNTSAHDLYKYDWSLDFKLNDEDIHIEQLDVFAHSTSHIRFIHNNLYRWTELHDCVLNHIEKADITLRIGGYIIDSWELIKPTINKFANLIEITSFASSSKSHLVIPYTVNIANTIIKLMLPVNGEAASTKTFDIICPNQTTAAVNLIKQDYRHALIYLTKFYCQKG